MPLQRTCLWGNVSAEVNLEHHSRAAADCRVLHLHLQFCRGRPCPGLHLTNRPPCTVPMVTQGQMVSPSWGVVPAFGTAQQLCFSCESPPRKRAFHGSLSTFTLWLLLFRSWSDIKCVCPLRQDFGTFDFLRFGPAKLPSAFA